MLKKNKMKKTFILLLFFAGFVKLNAQQIYFPPLSFNANWDTVSPSSLGWCLPEIDSLYNFLEKENSKAFIVLKDGKIVIEKYFSTFTKDSIWYWASAGKTVTSLLIGKAQEEGYLKITDTSSKYLGKGWTDCTEQQENKMSILNQLTMTTGLDDGVVDNHCTDKKCLIFKANVGTRWAYHNAPYTLLEKVITNATSATINNYTSQKLSLKTGIYGLWYYNNNDNVFYSKPRNMARFGLLFQNNCKWGNEAILNDTDYINKMINTSQNLNLSYGYLWWLNGKASYMVPTLQTVIPGSYAPQAPADMFAGIGKNGQIVCVSKSKGLVVVRMGDAPTNFGEVPTLFCNQIWQKLNAVMCNKTNADNTINLKESLTFYPNPSKNELVINNPLGLELSISIVSLLGNIQDIDVISNKINITNLSNGLYFLKIKSSNNTVIYKFLKE
jgi:CubicO group peptidase (beta-lactamase class C family)